jgi:excisionase family DNA binding protein
MLSPEDCARRCSLSRRAIYRAIERGELPAAKLCGRLRIDPDDLDAWITQSRVERSERVGHQPPVPLPASNGLRRLLAVNDEEVA